MAEQISDLCIGEETEKKKDVIEKTEEVKEEVTVNKDGAVQDIEAVHEQEAAPKTSTEKKPKVGANEWLFLFVFSFIREYRFNN